MALFAEEDAPPLKKWIVKRLENTSDADADVLADYVLALLRHDGDVAAVRSLFEAEIPDFLQEDSTVFIQDVFAAIQYGSYRPGAPSAPRFPLPSGPAFANLPMASTPREPQSSTRKRSYNDGTVQDGRDLQMGGIDTNGRTFKQPRRGGNLGRGGRFDSFGNDRGAVPPMHIGSMPPQGFQNMPSMPSPPPGMPAFDPNNPMAAIMAMQAMGFPVAGLPPFPQALSPTGIAFTPASQKAPRCRDYDTKGFCSRGNSCRFEHGNDSIYVPPRSPDEYDPTNAIIGTGMDIAPIGAPSASNNFQNFRGRDRGRGRGRGQDRGGGVRGPRRSEFSSDRPNYDHTNTTIVVENIPEDKFSEEDVRAFFSEFGNIVEITMKAYKHLAIVKYEDWNTANAAHTSPKVIFDNRFVKVYWFTNEDSLPKPSNGTNESGSNANIHPVPAPVRDQVEPQIDMDEFNRKQEEAQRSYDEKMKKKAEMEVAQKELEKRQGELMKSQAEERRKLMERLAAKAGKSGIPHDGSNGTISGDDKSRSQSEALKAQLAALEAEAKSLGLDTALTDDGAWAGRGRGRGRGGYRGRGAFVPRGGFRGSDRGGYRGRGGGAPFGGGGAYNLDNRPKRIALTGVDFTVADKEESLRQYLLGIGEFTDFEATPSRTSITFKDRFTAEKFMYGTTNGELPSIGKVDLAWVQTPLPPVNVPAKPATTIAAQTGDAMHVDEGDAMAQDSRPVHHAGQGHERQELDYDVGEDDWGIS